MTTVLPLLIGLPSVMLADEELFQDFFDNVVANLRIQHNPHDLSTLLSIKM